MAGNRRGFAGGTVHIHAVTAAFTEKLGTIAFNVTVKSIRFTK
jgi:hypothetical protein